MNQPRIVADILQRRAPAPSQRGKGAGADNLSINRSVEWSIKLGTPQYSSTTYSSSNEPELMRIQYTPTTRPRHFRHLS